MEIKYTLEILIKDIQDIEILVGNLQNSPEGSTLELDLALSKLRNVYDMLTVIRTDMALAGQSAASKPGPPVVKEEPAVAEEEPLVQEEKSPVAEEEPPVQEEKSPEAEEKPPVQEEKPAVAEEKLPVQEEKPPETGEEPPAEEPEPVQARNPEIIAEKFEAESSINENLAGNREPDMDSKLMGQPIDSIGRNIGINDRFLIIRELFDGDSDGFGKLVEGLDKAGDLDSANQLLKKQFKEVPEHEGIVTLANLVKRKYNRD